MVDASDLRKLQGLISRATHTGTGVEEARTCAMLACRLLSRLDLEKLNATQGIQDSGRDFHTRALALQISQLRAQVNRLEEELRQATMALEWRILANKYSGARCSVCATTMKLSELICWRRRSGAICLACARRAGLLAEVGKGYAEKEDNYNDDNYNDDYEDYCG